jgi:hypothetical protein
MSQPTPKSTPATSEICLRFTSTSAVTMLSPRGTFFKCAPYQTPFNVPCFVHCEHS